MPIYYYTEKDDKSDVWKKVVAGNQVSWYKNGAMRLGGPDMSKVYLSDNAGKPLSSGYHNYDMARKEQAIQRQGATMQIRSMESQMNALLNKANRLKSGGLSKDSDNNEVREYENSLIKYNELQKKYIKAGGSTSKYKYKNPSAYGIAQGADFDNDGIINSKDKDIDNDGVRNEKDRDDYNKVIGANPKSTKTNNAGLNPSRQKSNTPLGTNQPKQDTAKTAKPLNKIAKDTDKDGIANKYDIWDRTDGVPKSVNQLDELKRARNRLENKISLAQKSKSSDLKDDIAALKSDLNTVNSRIAKLRGATDNSGQTTPRGSNPLKPDPAKPVNPSKPTVLPSTNDMADLLDDDQFRQSYVRGRFKKAFGAKGDDVYEKAIDAMVAANPNGIRIKGDRKSGSYSVEVKDSKGAWTSRNIAVANVLVKYADFGGYNAVDKQATLERFNTRGAATISQVQARFDKAFGSGSGSSVMYGAVDKLLAQRVNGQEVAKEFGKRGEAGYFVAVKDSKGRWTSAGKAVTEALSKHVTDQQYSSSTVSKS
nr:hypothetical protein [Patescibacteria group bacterium]